MLSRRALVVCSPPLPSVDRLPCSPGSPVPALQLAIRPDDPPRVCLRRRRRRSWPTQQRTSVVAARRTGRGDTLPPGDAQLSPLPISAADPRLPMVVVMTVTSESVGITVNSYRGFFVRRHRRRCHSRRPTTRGRLRRNASRKPGKPCRPPTLQRRHSLSTQLSTRSSGTAARSTSASTANSTSRPTTCCSSAWPPSSSMSGP